MYITPIKIIGQLMVTAKMLGAAVRITRTPATERGEDALSKELAIYLRTSVELHGDGVELEADTIALAKELGFNIEQRYISPEAKA